MAIQGALPVEFGTVFPHGAFALGVEAVTNFETKRPEVDRETGLPLWAVEVIDAAPTPSPCTCPLRPPSRRQRRACRITRRRPVHQVPGQVPDQGHRRMPHRRNGGAGTARRTPPGGAAL